MLNEMQTVDAAAMQVVDYANPTLKAAMARGEMNTDEAQILANVRHAIRLGYPQVRPFPPRFEEICLVGSGPSLTTTEDDLRQLYFDGAKLVTMNGAYHWCIARNLRPSTQVVLDARPSNARFVEPAIPRCRYVLASQCAPETWAAVAGRENVWIFHAAIAATGPLRELLDAYYLNNWYGVGGGVTVATRALSLLSMLGYRRFHLFGVDSCWLGGQHHAFPQVENEADQWFDLTIALADAPETARTFRVSPWMCQQLDDFAQTIRVNGDHFLLQVHGDGLLAYALKIAAGGMDQLTTQVDAVAVG